MGSIGVAVLAVTGAVAVLGAGVMVDMVGVEVDVGVRVDGAVLVAGTVGVALEDAVLADLEPGTTGRLELGLRWVLLLGGSSLMARSEHNWSWVLLGFNPRVEVDARDDEDDE